jgi:hypothetical protein
MDFTCPSCKGTAFTLVSNVSGLQLANCSTCGTITPLEIPREIPQEFPLEIPREIEARHGDTPVAAMSEPRTVAWRRAEDKFTKTRKKLDDDVRVYQQQRWDAETEKMARLRALRLARDANPPEAKKPATRKARDANLPEAKKPAKRIATRKARPGNDGKGAVRPAPAETV